MTVQCRQCRESIDIPFTEEQLKRWKAGELIQRVMPELSPDQREVLISGICGTCFDRIFGV